MLNRLFRSHEPYVVVVRAIPPVRVAARVTSSDLRRRSVALRSRKPCIRGFRSLENGSHTLRMQRRENVVKSNSTG